MLATVIVFDDDVAGTIGSWGDPGEREVTYWIGRSYWGKGIATAALDAFLAVERSRPLHARFASDNVASRRVLGDVRLESLQVDPKDKPPIYGFCRAL